jgi:hypothetical protein
MQTPQNCAIVQIRETNMFRLLLIVFSITGLTAHAQTPQECPDNAEQILTNIRLSVGTPNQPTPQDMLNTARTASEICDGRTHAQALAADILGLLAGSATQAADRRYVWGLAHTAVRKSDQAYTSDGPAVTVTMATGATQTLYSYAPLTELLRTQVMPNLLASIKEGEVHKIFTTETLKTCPYSMNADGQARARAEADALVSWGYYQAKEALPYGVTRLTALKNACEGQTQYLTYALGTYYAKAANYRSMNETYPSKEWATKAEALLTEFIAMDLKRSDDRTTISMAKSQLEKARKVLGKVAP